MNPLGPAFPLILDPTAGGCGVVVYACPCNQGAGHDGPHTCDCGGSWTGTSEADFAPITYPGGRSLGGSIAAMLGFPDDEEDDE